MYVKTRTKHLYLLTLEVTPLTVGRTYSTLPLHCTLMHRFWLACEPDELASAMQSTFSQAMPLPLVARARTLLGPRQVPVVLLEQTKALEELNMNACQRLTQLGAEYTEPNWVGAGHIFHVTDRPQVRFPLETPYLCRTVYLIEINEKGERLVRHAFLLGAVI